VPSAVEESAVVEPVVVAGALNWRIELMSLDDNPVND